MSDPVGAWRRFWFRPEPAYTLGAVRIAFGVITVAWTLSLLPDLHAFFASDGVVSRRSAMPFQWGVFELWDTDRALIVGWSVLLLASIALILGWHSRISAVVVFVLILSFQFRNPYVFNSGDTLLRIEALLLALAPSGSALSLDQRRDTGTFWSAKVNAQWVIRLMQVQLTIVYLATFQARMQGHKWPDGTALSYALRLQDMLIVPVPEALITSLLLINIATWGVLLVELFIGIFVWNNRLRRYVLLTGVAMHCAIMLTVAVGFFTPAMLVLYLAFVSPEAIRKLPTRLQRKTEEPPIKSVDATETPQMLRCVSDGTRSHNGPRPTPTSAARVT